MANETIFEKRINLNNSHDWATVKAIRGYGELVEIEFEGRDPTTVTIRLVDLEDAKQIGEALIEAARALGQGAD